MFRFVSCALWYLACESLVRESPVLSPLPILLSFHRSPTVSLHFVGCVLCASSKRYFFSVGYRFSPLRLSSRSLRNVWCPECSVLERLSSSRSPVFPRISFPVLPSSARVFSSRMRMCMRMRSTRVESVAGSPFVFHMPGIVRFLSS